MAAGHWATEPQVSEIAATIRSSWAIVEPHSAELGRLFYGLLFEGASEIRSLFPVNMEVQRSRLLRAVVHVVQMVDRPAELTPFLAQLGRDHRKFDIATRHYDILGSALIRAVRHYAGPTWTPTVAAAWEEAYRIAAQEMQAAAAAERGRASWTGRVLMHRRLGWDVAIVTVQTNEPVPYKAGQYLSVETPQRPRLWRYLSPANPPSDDGMLEFHVRAVEGGWVSRAIVAHTRCGDTWRVGAPMGRLGLCRDSGADTLIVAGGTGMAPVKAMLREWSKREENPRTHFFVGGRTWENLYDYADLRTLSWRNRWLDVVPVLEDDSNLNGAEKGTLADAVARYGAWCDHDVIVCGSPAMIRATVSRMLVSGTPLNRIHYDPFTMD